MDSIGPRFTPLATVLLVSVIAVWGAAADARSIRVEGAGPRVGPDGHTAESIGLETIAGVVPLLAAGCAAPCSTTETFVPSVDAQPQLTFRLNRGAAGPIGGNTIGEFRIEGCPSGSRGTPWIALTITTVGRDITLSARDIGSSTACPIVHVGR